MAYAINLYFDPKSEDVIRNIWEELARTEISTYLVGIDGRPHITLAIYEDVNYIQLMDRLNEFASDVYSFDISCSHIGVFPKNKGTVFFAPTMTEELLKLHRDFHQAFQDIEKQCWDYYKPNSWFPHCTISTETSEEVVPNIIKHVLNMYNHIEIKIESIGIVELDPIEYLLELKLRTPGS